MVDVSEILRKAMNLHPPRPEDIRTITGETLDEAAAKYTHLAVVVPLDTRDLSGMKNTVAAATFIFQQMRMRSHVIPVTNGTLPPGAKVKALMWLVE